MVAETQGFSWCWSEITPSLGGGEQEEEEAGEAAADCLCTEGGGARLRV